MYPEYLAHYGIKGMRWGKRKRYADLRREYNRQRINAEELNKIRFEREGQNGVYDVRRTTSGKIDGGESNTNYDVRNKEISGVLADRASKKRDDDKAARWRKKRKRRVTRFMREHEAIAVKSIPWVSKEYREELESNSQKNRR